MTKVPVPLSNGAVRVTRKLRRSTFHSLVMDTILPLDAPEVGADTLRDWLSETVWRIDRRAVAAAATNCSALVVGVCAAGPR